MPKLRTLVELLHGHFTRKPSSRVIAFVSRRATVSALCAQLADASETRGLVRARAFVGRGRNQGAAGAAAEGMDQAEQQRVLAAFRGGLAVDGGCNVLVATCVAEEGLDIGEVDLIVCFDAVSSPIRLVQRLGRTGRQREGEAVLLLTEAEQREYAQTAARAQKLVDAVDNGHGIRLKPRAAPLLSAEPPCVYYPLAPREEAPAPPDAKASSPPPPPRAAAPLAALPSARPPTDENAAPHHRLPGTHSSSPKRAHHHPARPVPPWTWRLAEGLAESSSEEDEMPLDQRRSSESESGAQSQRAAQPLQQWEAPKQPRATSRRRAHGTPPNAKRAHRHGR